MRLRPADRASEHRPTDAVALPRIGDGDRDLSHVVADRLDADVTDDHGIAARVEAFRHDPFPVLVIRPQKNVAVASGMRGAAPWNLAVRPSGERPHRRPPGRPDRAGVIDRIR